MQPHAKRRHFDYLGDNLDEVADDEHEDGHEKPQIGGRNSWKERKGLDSDGERLYSIVPERCTPKLPPSSSKKEYRGSLERAAKKAWRDNKGWGAAVIALTAGANEQFPEIVDLRGKFFAHKCRFEGKVFHNSTTVTVLHVSPYVSSTPSPRRLGNIKNGKGGR